MTCLRSSVLMSKPSCYASQPNVISQAENDCGRCPFNGTCITETSPTQWTYDQVCKANEEKRVKIEQLKKCINLLHKEATWSCENAIINNIDQNLMVNKITEAEALYKQVFGEKLESNDKI